SAARYAPSLYEISELGRHVRRSCESVCPDATAGTSASRSSDLGVLLSRSFGTICLGRNAAQSFPQSDERGSPGPNSKSDVQRVGSARFLSAHGRSKEASVRFSQTLRQPQSGLAVRASSPDRGVVAPDGDGLD